MSDDGLGKIANLRDVGDSVPGIRSGVLWRSDAPHSGDADPGFTPWPPPLVLDLRDFAERREDHPFGNVSEIVDLPLLGGAAALDADPAEAEGFFRHGLGHIYRSLLDGAPAEMLLRAIGEIADADGPVLVHCTAGKDRTGATVALVLSLVGVAEDAILADYALTAANLPRVHARATKTVSAHTLGAQLGLTLPRTTFQAVPEAMASFLAELSDRGGARAWFFAAGGSAEVLELLERRLLR